MMITRPATRAAAILGLMLGVSPASSDHGQGVPVRDYTPRNGDEAAIQKLILTVGEGWERKDVERILSAYAPDAVQRAWNEPGRMVGVAGIRAEALGAFADPKLGTVRFDDWIHRIYIVNASASSTPPPSSRSTRSSMDGVGITITETSGCSRVGGIGGGSSGTTTNPRPPLIAVNGRW